MAPKRSPRQTTRRRVPEGCSGTDLDSHQDLVTRLYRIEKRSLKQVRKIMSEQFNIHVSEKVFKDRISRWNIQRNLSKKDVAVALHLRRQAERSKRTCRLYIRGQRVDWKRIQAYLKKNKIGTESFSETESYDVIPSYITFDFVDSVAATPSLAIPHTRPGPDDGVTSSSHLTPNSTPSGSQATTNGSSSRLTPEISSNSSMGATSDRHDLDSGSQTTVFGEAAPAALAAETNQIDLPLQWEYPQVGLWTYDELAGPTPEFLAAIVQQYVGHLVDNADPPAESTDLFDLYRLMSVTPPSASHSPRPILTPLGDIDSSLYLQYHMSNETKETDQNNSVWIGDRSDNHVESEPETIQPLGCPTHFLSWSIAACLRKNEGMDHDAELAIKEASESFKMMVASRHERCLTSLNLLLALLEAHGKREIAFELLGKFNVAIMSLKSFPEKEPVLLTIRFKMDIMCRLKIDNMFGPAVLRRIHYDFERSWGQDSPSSLACLCNLGWRLAGDRDAGRLTEALDVLSRARVGLERTLGLNDPQTITCLTMLARVLYNLERHVDGLEMMRTAMNCIVVRFPEYHPYRLAALRRCSLFMQKAGGGNAEPILREVAARRLRVLGTDSELTRGSMKELGDFLIEQGRNDDAEDTSRAIAELASRMSCGDTVIQSF